MENTTKALIMAAGVLLAIVILSLTVYFVNSFQGFTQDYNASLEKQQLDKFNSNFTIFEGRNNISMHEIATIVNLAKEFNKTNNLKSVDSQYIHVCVNINSKEIDLTKEDDKFIDSLLDGSYIEEKIPSISNGGHYRVESEYSNSNKKEKITYYNCYKWKKTTINSTTERIEKIEFEFQKDVIQTKI